MEGWEGSGDGRVTPETKALVAMCRQAEQVGLLPKDPGQPGPWQGNTPSTPGRGPSRRGGRASEQGDGTPAAGSVDQVESTLQRRITWANILQADFHRGPFPGTSCLWYPAKLHVWGKSETPSCLLCSGRGSLEHLLSSCPKALADGRYRWRHDQVLKANCWELRLSHQHQQVPSCFKEGNLLHQSWREAPGAPSFNDRPPH